MPKKLKDRVAHVIVIRRLDSAGYYYAVSWENASHDVVEAEYSVSASEVRKNVEQFLRSASGYGTDDVRRE